MALFLASMVVLFSLASALSCQSRTDYLNNHCLNSDPRIPPQNDKCIVSRDTLIRVLRWIISLISQLQEAGEIAREQEAGNAKITQFSTYPCRSFSFFPIYYRNNLPWCN
ncbi:unnamed protein product [Nezara viridula]|uniref:Neuropeptide n=1 Tax=Nezara viridula TaxID=85310 RepID=A0A9P0MS81_NEZVI|nr:unnamed protein product [Nezara viridula]